MGIFFDINWLAVIIATIASALVSYLWYGPLFGKRWAAALAAPAKGPAPVTESAPVAESAAAADSAPAPAEEKKAKAGSLKNAPHIMIAITLVQCFLISSLIDYYKGSLGSVILWAIVIWFAIVAPMLASQWLYEKRSQTLTLICAGHQLVSLVVVAFILGVWY